MRWGDLGGAGEKLITCDTQAILPWGGGWGGGGSSTPGNFMLQKMEISVDKSPDLVRCDSCF